MAERRMFTKKITDADAFTELPPTSQALYFHLCMGADDDGFSNQIRRAMFSAHADRHDFELLVQKRFIIPFESGVIVIKHWRMHNLIKSDRYKETSYMEEKAMLVLKDNGVYSSENSGTQVEHNWNQNGTQVEPQVRLGKDRTGEDSKGEVSIEDVCTEPLASSEPEAALDAPAIILNDGSEWRPTVADINEWRKFYSGIDVVRELGRMRQWCISNPAKRKTARGVRRFVTNWLDSEQNRQGKYSRSGQNQKDKYTQRMEDMQNWGRQFESNNES